MYNVIIYKMCSLPMKSSETGLLLADPEFLFEKKIKTILRWICPLTSVGTRFILTGMFKRRRGRPTCPLPPLPSAPKSTHYLHLYRRITNLTEWRFIWAYKRYTRLYKRCLRLKDISDDLPPKVRDISGGFCFHWIQNPPCICISLQ